MTPRERIEAWMQSREACFNPAASEHYIRAKRIVRAALEIIDSHHPDGHEPIPHNALADEAALWKALSGEEGK